MPVSKKGTAARGYYGALTDLAGTMSEFKDIGTQGRLDVGLTAIEGAEKAGFLSHAGDISLILKSISDFEKEQDDLQEDIEFLHDEGLGPFKPDYSDKKGGQWDESTLWGKYKRKMIDVGHMLGEEQEFLTPEGINVNAATIKQYADYKRAYEVFPDLKTFGEWLTGKITDKDTDDSPLSRWLPGGGLQLWNDPMNVSQNTIQKPIPENGAVTKYPLAGDNEILEDSDDDDKKEVIIPDDVQSILDDDSEFLHGEGW